MELQHGSDESAVLLLHEEAAYADLGTTRSEPVKEISAPKVSVVFLFSDRSYKRAPLKVYDATAPPRRAA